MNIETDTDRNSAPGTRHSASPSQDTAKASGGEPTRARNKASSAVTDRDTWLRALRGLTPPEIWSEDRPSLRKQWYYAAYGSYTGKSGVARALGKAYARFVSLPTSALAYYFEWICERPSRLIAALVLAFIAAQIPAVRWLIATLTAPLAWLFNVSGWS